MFLTLSAVNSGVIDGLSSGQEFAFSAPKRINQFHIRCVSSVAAVV